MGMEVEVEVEMEKKREVSMIGFSPGVCCSQVQSIVM
jgi:hypothetical protein